jgi:hypothetical protein
MSALFLSRFAPSFSPDDFIRPNPFSLPRFKMTGQFWSLEGDEAFLALSTLQRNGRWGKLFPGSHVSRSCHAPE